MTEHILNLFLTAVLPTHEKMKIKMLFSFVKQIAIMFKINEKGFSIYSL